MCHNQIHTYIFKKNNNDTENSRREIIKKELNVNSIIKKHNNKSRTQRTGFTTWTQLKKESDLEEKSEKNNSECKRK